MGRLLASGLTASCAVALAACSPSGISAFPKAALPSATTTTTLAALPATPPSSSPEKSAADGLVPPWPQLHDTLVLKTSTAVAGKASISGTLVVINSGSEAVNLSGGCRPSFMVVLTSSSYAPTLAWAGECPYAPFLIHPGVNRLPFSILTTYLSCAQGPGTPSRPRCLGHPPNRMPPLRAGAYSAVLRGNGIALPPPPSVTVTLTS